MAGRVRNGEILGLEFAFTENSMLIPCSEHQMIINGNKNGSSPPMNNVKLFNNRFDVAHIIKCARAEGFTIYQ